MTFSWYIWHFNLLLVVVLQGGLRVGLQLLEVALQGLQLLIHPDFVVLPLTVMQCDIIFCTVALLLPIM